ncbi:tetratricopeptide repeat protein [Winogradskyella sp.]|uniref:tetratricopeptide repeat protein n=1 Tax=Winogradskyella sp. TaxID=1883156 RepID=UPI00262129C7|nr:tetratricopeptide repeat protein [Winogradskyella sp.]
MKIFYILLVLSFCPLLQAQSNSEASVLLDKDLYRLKTELETAKNQLDKSKIAKAELDLGNFFNQLKLYSEATKHYQAFLEIHKYEDMVLVNVQNVLAKINLNLNKYEDAKQHALTSQKAASQINYFRGKAVSNTLLGNVAEKQGDYENALQYQNLSLSIFKTLNDSTGLARTNESIGSIYEDLEQYDLAHNYFMVASQYALNSDSDLQINITNNLGDIYRKTKRYNEAIEQTQKALLMAKENNNQTQQVSALKDLSKTYAELGDFEKAFDYLNNQSIVNEDELAKNNMQLISAMEVLYGVKEKEAEVKLLNKQNQINKVQKQVILVIAIAILMTLIIGLIYWKKRRKHEQHIFEYKQQLLQADLDKKIVEEEALNREIDIKVSSLTNYSLNLAHKNKLLSSVSKTLVKLQGRNSQLINKKLKELVRDIEFDLNNNSEWTELMGYFGRIHPSFFESIKNVATKKLSSSEMRLCMLLRLNLSSKEIAEILHITPDSVRIARYRLRKKLPLDSQQDLQDYLFDF